MKAIIPLDNELPSYDMDIDLLGIQYNLSISWNVRGEFWHFILSDATGLKIASGVGQTNYPLFANNTDDKFPKGLFWLVDTTDKNQDITRDNFGTEIILIFTDED